MVFVACAALWLVGLGFRGLFNPDEGRYAEIPREMLASGDWVIPHLNGLVYIEKPPLQYWATAISEATFGENDWAARLYTGLCALATVYALWAMARREWGAAAATRAAIMLGSSLLFVLLGHQLTLDMSLTLFTTLDLRGILQCAACDTLAGLDAAQLGGHRRCVPDQGSDRRGAAAAHAASSTRHCSGILRRGVGCCWGAARALFGCCVCRG